MPADGTGCEVFSINATAGEYVTRGAAIYDSEKVTMLVVESNTGARLVKGQNNGGQVKTWSVDTAANTIAGFHGSQTADSVVSIGGIMYKKNCTFERAAPAQGGFRGIIIAVLVVVMVIIIGAGVFIMMRKRKSAGQQGQGMQMTKTKIQPTEGSNTLMQTDDEGLRQKGAMSATDIEDKSHTMDLG